MTKFLMKLARYLGASSSKQLGKLQVTLPKTFKRDPLPAEDEDVIYEGTLTMEMKENADQRTSAIAVKVANDDYYCIYYIQVGCYVKDPDTVGTLNPVNARDENGDLMIDVEKSEKMLESCFNRLATCLIPDKLPMNFIDGLEAISGMKVYYTIKVRDLDRSTSTIYTISHIGANQDKLGKLI